MASSPLTQSDNDMKKNPQQQDMFAEPEPKPEKDPREAYLSLPYGSEERARIWESMAPRCGNCDTPTDVRVTDGRGWYAPCCGREACSTNVHQKHINESKA